MDQQVPSSVTPPQAPSSFWTKKKLILIVLVLIICMLGTTVTVYVKAKANAEKNAFQNQEDIYSDIDNPLEPKSASGSSKNNFFGGAFASRQEIIQECLNEEELSDRCKDVYDTLENCNSYDAQLGAECAQKIPSLATVYPQQCESIQDEQKRLNCQQNRQDSTDYTLTP